MGIYKILQINCMFLCLQSQYLHQLPNISKSKKTYVQKSNKKQEAMNLIPAKTKAPISKTSTEGLKLAFKHYRTENKSLKEKIDELQSKIK